MKIKILPFDRYHGRRLGSIGSSVIRAKWLSEVADDISIWTQGCQADAIIFQKVWWESFMRDYKGVKILDMCDPDHMKGDIPIIQACQLVDAITTSSEALKKEIEQYTDKPVYYVPDRVKLDEFPKHEGTKGKALTVGWFGYYHNAKDLFGQRFIIDSLAKHKLNLKIISNQDWLPSYGVNIEIENVRFDWDSLPYEIQGCDFMINPKPYKKRFRFKSNNKTLISWACGVPVAGNEDDMIKFIDEKARKTEMEKRKKELVDKWDIKQSAKQYREIICQVINQKSGL